MKASECPRFCTLNCGIPITLNRQESSVAFQILNSKQLFAFVHWEPIMLGFEKCRQPKLWRYFKRSGYYGKKTVGKGVGRRQH